MTVTGAAPRPRSSMAEIRRLRRRAGTHRPPLLDTGNVTFSDFTVMNPGLTGGARYHVFGKPISALSTVTVFNLVIPGVTAADYGFYSDRPVGTVVFLHNVLTNNAFNPILIERPVGSTNVHHNTISGHGSTAIFSMTYSGNDVTTLQTVANNTITGPTSSGISFNGGFDGGPSTGRYTNVSILNNTITGVGASRIGINLQSMPRPCSEALAAIENPVVSGNVITARRRNQQGHAVRGLVINATITGNDVRNLERAFRRGHQHALGDRDAVALQQLVGTHRLFWDGVAAVNAENNWWGCNAGPVTPAAIPWVVPVRPGSTSIRGWCWASAGA
jgi:hypothetical protein